MIPNRSHVLEQKVKQADPCKLQKVWCKFWFQVVFLTFFRRKRKGDDQNGQENQRYGATEDEVKVRVNGQKVTDPAKVTGGRVMNIYTNPSEHLDQMTALQRLQLAGSEQEEQTMMLLPSGGECNGHDLDDENIRNQNLEDASGYLEPQVCMAHRPLPKVTVKVKPQGQEVKVKRKPQRFVRPKSPVPLNRECHTYAKVMDKSCQNENSQMVENPENHYEDAEDVDENEYSEIPGDNIYETLDEMKKSLATMGEAEA